MYYEIRRRQICLQTVKELTPQRFGDIFVSGGFRNTVYNVLPNSHDFSARISKQFEGYLYATQK